MSNSPRCLSVRGIAVGLALGLLVPLAVGQLSNGPLRAQPQAAGPTAREAAGTIAFTAQAPDASQLLYIIDTHNQSFAVYRVDTRDSKGAVKLQAARQYRWDLKLAEFNNQAPEVATIESMVGSPRR